MAPSPGHPRYPATPRPPAPSHRRAHFRSSLRFVGFRQKAQNQHSRCRRCKEGAHLHPAVPRPAEADEERAHAFGETGRLRLIADLRSALSQGVLLVTRSPPPPSVFGVLLLSFARLGEPRGVAAFALGLRAGWPRIRSARCERLGRRCLLVGYTLPSVDRYGLRLLQCFHAFRIGSVAFFMHSFCHSRCVHVCAYTQKVCDDSRVVDVPIQVIATTLRNLKCSVATQQDKTEHILVGHWRRQLTKKAEVPHQSVVRRVKCLSVWLG